jgi:dinuclear metal center YbgI/SA1388 family protein
LPDPARLDDVVKHLDTVLETRLFRDFAPNGLQVEGRPTVARVVTGVSANLALVEKAAAKRADLIVVHHGLVWGQGIDRVTGQIARRLHALLSNQISLAAYHLPLDKHARLGNNAGLADALGLPATRTAFGDVRGQALGVAVDLPAPITRAALLERVQTSVLGGSPPNFVFPHGPDRVKKIGLCTGAASDLLEDAARIGCDAFVTGELHERAGELARELRITLIGAGHHATEVYGPMRLAAELKAAFPGLDAEFVDVPSPL